MNKEIFKTNNFTVEAFGEPHISRMDGGHIVIIPKERFSDRTQLPPSLAIELIRLTMVAGEAMATALNKRGIDVGRINYQENGNWSVFAPEGPYLHVHLYGRAKSATIQKYGDACNFPHRDTGFYDSFESLNDGDIEAIRKEMDSIFKQEKYLDQNWHI